MIIINPDQNMRSECNYIIKVTTIIANNNRFILKIRITFRICSDALESQLDLQAPPQSTANSGQDWSIQV